MRDIEFSVLEAQQDIHEMIAQQKPLEQTLEAIANWVGKMMPGALVSIMRFYQDTNSLEPCAQQPVFRQFFPGHAEYSGCRGHRNLWHSGFDQMHGHY